MTVEIEAKVKKVGSSYGLLIPKALVDCKVLPLGSKILIKVITPSEVKTPLNEKPQDNGLVVLRLILSKEMKQRMERVLNRQ